MIEFDPDRRTVDIAITCHDFATSLAFYRDLLGFEVVVDTQISDAVATQLGLAPQGFHQVRLRAGDSLIKLTEARPAPDAAAHDQAAGVRWLTMYVVDIERTIADLEARGIEFIGGPLTGEHATAVVCKAPDGILVEFAQV